MQLFSTAHVHVGLIDGGHLHCGRTVLEDSGGLTRIFMVELHMAVKEDGMRAQLGRGAERHGGMYTEFASFIRGGGNHSSLVPLAAYYHGFALQVRVAELLH